jgi:hypothetical protein
MLACCRKNTRLVSVCYWSTVTHSWFRGLMNVFVQWYQNLLCILASLFQCFYLITNHLILIFQIMCIIFDFKILFAIIFIISDEIFQLSHVVFNIQVLSRKYKMWIKFFSQIHVSVAYLFFTVFTLRWFIIDFIQIWHSITARTGKPRPLLCVFSFQSKPKQISSGLFRPTIVPSKLRNDRVFRRFVSDSFVNYEGIFVYLVITIRCKRRVKNCKFQFDYFDSSDS